MDTNDTPEKKPKRPRIGQPFQAGEGPATSRYDRPYNPGAQSNSSADGDSYRPQRPYNNQNREGGYQPRPYNQNREGGYQPRQPRQYNNGEGGYQPRQQRPYNKHLGERGYHTQQNRQDEK
ncbi:MAG: hypothetical protein K2M55_00460, partial [Muribaculaceae bacterium]|nr:hypothetical protein [Muribaculaceae bacterium]